MGIFSAETLARLKRLREGGITRARVSRLLTLPFWAIHDRLGDLIFERALDSRTAREEYANDPDRAEAGHLPYGATDWLDLVRAMWAVRPGPDDVFVDFGSGKGRVLSRAATYQLRRVVGVELSEPLNEIARANLAVLRPLLKTSEIELVTADAAAWEVPDDMTIGYFANPFLGDVFRAVIDNIVRSIDRNPRRVRLVYVNPVEEAKILATGRFRVTRRLRRLRKQTDSPYVAFYESV